MATDYCHTIGCTQCNKTNSLPVKFSFTVEYTAGNSTPKEWAFHFCNLKCFFAWLPKIKKSGIPCQDCGYRVRGKCLTCHGKKYIKKTKMTGFAKIPEWAKSSTHQYVQHVPYVITNNNTDNQIKYCYGGVPYTQDQLEIARRKV